MIKIPQKVPNNLTPRTELAFVARKPTLVVKDVRNVAVEALEKKNFIIN
jgi:hypothetical protein